MPATSATSWAEIDLAALRHNVGVLHRQAAPAGVAAVIKADAYGHGAITVAEAALEAGATPLCTFTAREAVELREAGVNAPILSLGPVLPNDPELIARYDIAAVVDSADTATSLAETARANGCVVRVQINIDSGMQRYGLPHEAAISVAESTRRFDSLNLEGVFTHFPDAGAVDRSTALEALERFQRTADRIGPPMRHAAASAATFNLPPASLDFIRAGIALYGMDPSPPLAHPAASRLRPVMSWRTTLLAIRDVLRGESVSYGGLWTAGRDSRIGVVGVGYADGLSRALSPGGEMLVRGRRARIRGAICMDCAMIDLTDIPDAALGDTVTIIGRDRDAEIHAWELARQLGTIPYEIFTCVSARVPRIPLNQTD